MICPQCQRENPAGSSFCNACGVRLDVICHACAHVNPAGSRFCNGCGQPLSAGVAARFAVPEAYTPKHLADKILTSRASLEGERKQVTVLFADLKSSMELLAHLDPEEARAILDPILDRMMSAIHRYEGTVNQVMGDGIMALFGAPLAHEDHAVRACYAALRMQASVNQYVEELQQRNGPPVRIRVGLNSGEVVVRSIGNDLRMDYSAVGQSTHLAARMEQMALPGSIFITGDTWKLAEGFVTARALGAMPVRGLSEPVEIYELLDASAVRSRFGAAAARGLTRFVGRATELRRLVDALAGARLGHGQIVAVVGEPGVGKSRLLHEFVRSPRTRGWLIGEGGCTSHGKATSYLPLIDLLKIYFGLEPVDDGPSIRKKVDATLRPLGEEVLRTLPALVALMEGAIDEADAEWQGLDPSRRRRLTLDAVKELLVRQSQVQPLLLVLEDLQWVDSETQALLDELVGSLPTTRLLLLVSYRPEYQHTWANRSYYTQLRLDPLPPPTAHQLLAALAGEHPTIDPLKRLLIERTEGNPFFLEESVRTLVELKVLEGEKGEYRLAREITTIDVPPTVQAVLASRIDRLSVDDKRLLQSAAVIGKHVPYAILHAIAEVSEPQLRGALANLRAAEFLYETRLFPDLEYGFKHSLTQEVAYGSLLLDRRRTLHAAIVDAIERIHASRLADHADVLAYHALHGEVWGKAVQHLRQAAAQATARSAHQEAVTHLEGAIGALEHVADTRERTECAIDLRFALRNSLFALGNHTRTLEYLTDAEDLARRLGDRHRLGWVACYLMVHSLLVGQYEQIIHHGQRAREAGVELAELPLQIVGNLGLGQAYHAMGRYADALEALGQTVAALHGGLVTQRFGMSSPPSVACYTWLAWCHSERGEFAEGLARGKEGLRIAEAVKDSWGRAGARFGLGLVHLLQGHWAKAIVALESGLKISRTFNLRTWFPALAAALGQACCESGDVAKGLPLIEEAVAQASAMGLMVRHSSRVCSLGEAYLVNDRVADALQTAQLALQLARDHGEQGYEAWSLRLLGAVAARNRLPAEADEYYHDALTLAERLGMRPLLARCHLDLGMLYSGTGRSLEAQKELVDGLAAFDSMGMSAWSRRATVALSQLT